MKKNKLFRLLTLALTLVFLCQFAVPAFAATSDPWSDGSSTYYLVTTRTGYYTRPNQAIETATLSHTRGFITYLGGVYYMEYTDVSWHGDYGGEAKSTAAKDGYYDTCSKENVEYLDNAALFIPQTAASGAYCIRTNVDCNRIAFDVYQDGIIYANGEAYSPYDFGGVVTGYKAL